MSGQDSDRNEAATPHKLKEAQQRGQVAKSQEAIFASILAALVLVLFSVGPSLARRELILVEHTFTRASQDNWAEPITGAWLASTIASALTVLAPLFLAIVISAIVANVSQVGAVFSFHPISPDFERINPAAGLKRIFSLTLLYNAGKSTLKLVALTWVLWIILRQSIPHLFQLGQIDVHAHGSVVMGEVAPLLFKLLLVIAILALLDIAYTRWDFSKKMRMSRREVRDEHKNREGDPRIRARLRQLRAELLKQSRALRALPEADVLITNPTHISVAISYKHGTMPAPKLLAKGAGGLASKMRKVARQLNIPVVENPPLARALYKRLGAGEYLPEDLYPLTAKILLWVYARRNTRARLGVSR